MQDSLPDKITAMAWRVAGATLVMGLALFCGRYVEEAAAARHRANLERAEPQDITPLSASLVTRDAADVQTRLPAMTCSPALTLQARPGATLDLTLAAPCAADGAVTVSHGGMTFAVRMPYGRPLHLELPALEASGRVELGLPDGTRTAAAAPLDMGGLHRFALDWKGADGFHLQGAEVVTLGDADLPQPRRAAILTEVGSEVMASVASTPALCGQSLIGRTISSRDGRAESTALRVDLPDCALGTVVLPLKNLDPGTKLALR